MRRTIPNYKVFIFQFEKNSSSLSLVKIEMNYNKIFTSENQIITINLKFAIYFHSLIHLITHAVSF